MIKNPFRYSGPIIKDDPEYGSTFVDRTEICRVIVRHIQQGDYIQIVGSHQSGRTTLAIDLIGKLLSKPETAISSIPVLISCESLMDACREGFIETIIIRLRRVMKEYLTENTYAVIGSMLKAPIPKTILDFYNLLIAFGKEVRKLTKFSEIVFFLDEVEALPHNLAVDILRLFRALFHNYAERRWEAPYRVIIMTTHDLSYWRLGNSSPYNISNIIPVKPFSQQEIDILLDKNHAGKALKKVTFSKSSRLRIYQETGGQPYLVQRLCHLLIERIRTKDHRVILTDKNVMEAVLGLFEKGDKTLQNLYGEVRVGSEEWQLYGRLATGKREPFEADNPAIRNFFQQGAITDANHYCMISARIYERQILKRHFWEEFAQVIDSFADKERLLLHVSCLQKILINGQIGQSVFARIEDLTHDDSLSEGKITKELSEYLDILLKDQEADLDMREIHIYFEYYNMEPIKSRKKALSVLARAFIDRYKEVKAEI